MRTRGKRSRVPDALGGRLFGGSRRTARQFVTVVGLVFALVGVLVLQTWLRVEMVETMEENRNLEKDLAELLDRVICQEMQLERVTARDQILRRAEENLGLRSAAFGEVVFVPDSSWSLSAAERPAPLERSRKGAAP